MITEIAAAYGSLKAAADIIKGMNAVADAVAINDVKFALQGHILEAQQGLFAAQEAQTAAAKRIAELEQQIVDFKNWEREAERHELVAIRNTGFVYMQKAGMRTSEPAHWLCANCFSGRKKSILQKQGKQGEVDRPWVCPSCDAGFTLPHGQSPQYLEPTEQGE